MSSALRRSLAAFLATVFASLALFPAYATTEWLWSAVLAALFVTTIGFVLRQVGTPRLLVPLGQLAALGWAFVLVYAPHDLRFGFLPTGESVLALAHRINDGLLIVVRYAAPVPYDADLVMVTAIGIGLVAIAVDLLAATYRLTPWAGLPLLLVYSIPATTVSGGISALAFVPAAIGYVVLLLGEGRERLGRWGRVIGLADDVAGPQETVQTSLLGQTGRRVSAAVIGLAVVVPAVVPTLPESVLGRGEGGGIGPASRTIKVNNPIVDLKRDLKRPQDFPVMTYTTGSNSPDYIKLVTLDEFDGDRWRPSPRSVSNVTPDRTEYARLPDPPGLRSKVAKTSVTTKFQVTDALQSRWLPTPYPPTAVKTTADWGYDPETLDIVLRGQESAGLSYDVRTLDIDYTPSQLRDAGPPPAAVFDRYTKLPPNIPKEVLRLARAKTAKARTAYDKAVALQSWFRNDFIYDLEVQPGHGGSAMLEFLADKRGYCEQFAATMAIMARSLDIPARVGVGYMPGTRQADGRWLVTSHDSHAWPELYFAGYGWVRFEPTPQSQTGVAPVWTVPDTNTPNTPIPDQRDNPEDPRQNRNPSSSPTPLAHRNDHINAVPTAPTGPAFNVLPLLVVLVALLIVAMPMLARFGIRRSRLSQRDPERLVEAAWRELADVTTDLGVPWDNATTPRTAGVRLADRLPASAHQALRTVVDAVERGRYAPAPGEVGDVRAAVATVTRALFGQVTLRRRLRAWLAPVSLWRRLPALWSPVSGLLDRVDTLGPRLARRWRRGRMAGTSR
ncbi:transglutaminase TgpA family protein [Actinopolymorpha singaporensis]|uniref:Transglutaminase-like domain-containing protein n=1 Tax=Actinopolymorpha singaporensis TaxID=117157 RepID=A0A1H1X7J4_9ACTN|nr:DUF3488 and transglutaminase-like domain-containing protein [Actinopolymorpha singaporensis]SDT04569.1 protein of unknown function [Actinopolymorpha singaporensis]